mgnify:CR=1 FL=1
MYKICDLFLFDTKNFLNTFSIVQTGDGLQDIAVISAGGLHLLQLNYRLVIDKLLEKITEEKNIEIKPS